MTFLSRATAPPVPRHTAADAGGDRSKLISALATPEVTSLAVRRIGARVAHAETIILVSSYWAKTLSALRASSGSVPDGRTIRENRWIPGGQTGTAAVIPVGAAEQGSLAPRRCR